MAFGYKVKKIKFQNEYLIADLFEAIKDQEFSAGKPDLIKYLANTVIVFPALDTHNQVQIMASTLKAKPTQAFVIQKGDELNAKGAATNLILDSATKGLTSLTRAFGSNPKECERLVDATFAELTAMGL